MVDTKFACWEVKVQSKEMDMSGGDNIDGPRWTGGFLEGEVTLVIVAPSKALAEAAAISAFYDHQRAKVKGAKKIHDVHAVVQCSGLGERNDA